MKQLRWLLSLLLLVSFSSCAGTIKHTTTDTVRVAGNCGICKNTIESAANRKGLVEATWDKDTKLLKLTYDSLKTSVAEVLKRIAYSGYDNEQFLAPDDAYAKLQQCCQYERMKKEVAVPDVPSNEIITEEIAHESELVTNRLADVYTAYFATKNALVKDNGTAASSNAKALVNAIKAVDMNTMATKEHAAWMAVEKDLLAQATHISQTTNLEEQRGYFASLSTHLYRLVNVFQSDQTMYLQHCPMYHDGEGADWLSKEQTIQNPYYGSSMLSCGKTIETIK